MGITVHYRGKIDDIRAIEALEDCVIDLALAFGGQVRLWHSVSDHDPQRAVRGALVNLDPGQETLALLFSPEGVLVPLMDIEEAEKGLLGEMPWCYVKTQFGSVEGHVALVETLSEVKRQFIPQLEVSDESDYWSHRDPHRLADLMRKTASIIQAVSVGLEKHPLKQEASEDQNIVAERVTRIAQQVHQVFRQRDQQPTHAGDVKVDFQAEWTETEAQWDQLYCDSTARSFRMQRHIESKLLAGLSTKEALESAFKEFADENAPADETAPEYPSENSSDLESRFEEIHEEEPSNEPWTESLDLVPSSHAPVPERDPLLEQATQLYLEAAKLAQCSSESAVESLFASAGQLCGGLSQVLPLPPRYEMHEDDRGLTVVQLKRALRGAAFLQAALYNLQLDEDNSTVRTRLLKELEEIQGEIVTLLRDTRA